MESAAALTPEQEQEAFEAEFKKYADYVKEHQEEVKKNQTREVALQIYSLAKQGTFGDNTEKKPGMLQIVEKMKYNAWMAHKASRRSSSRVRR